MKRSTKRFLYIYISSEWREKGGEGKKRGFTAEKYVEVPIFAMFRSFLIRPYLFSSSNNSKFGVTRRKSGGVKAKKKIRPN